MFFFAFFWAFFTSSLAPVFNNLVWFKNLLFVILFEVMRAILPRYRYDQLMKLGWKCFLPLALALFILSVGMSTEGLECA